MGGFKSLYPPAGFKKGANELHCKVKGQVSIQRESRVKTLQIKKVRVKGKGFLDDW